ncbi:MAG: zinc-dependent metalloprotease, partial [Ornithinimicrobium sp.]|uniref:zinc-dependent metalloprotease n=1 Tax=Ornithinimicrobium sp. TaxID=1977084 RepID=UPI003D9BC02A
MSADPISSAPLAPSPARGRDFVDWDFAARAARRMAPAGPTTDPGEVAELVQELRDAAARSVGPVAGTSRLSAPQDASAPLVVDRAGWIQANTRSLEGMIGPVPEDVPERPRKLPRATE